MDISLQALTSDLNLPQNITDYLSKYWEQLTAGVSETLPFYLTEDYFRTYYPYTHSPVSSDEATPYVQDVIRKCSETPALNLLAQLIYNSSFSLLPEQAFGEWPEVLPFLGENYTGTFYFMISIGAYPLIAKTHQKLGLPSSYALDILAWLGGTMKSYGESHQHRPGRPGAFGWIRHYIEGTLFRLGRLEYLVHPYIDWMPAIYEDAQGNVAVLARNNWYFTDTYHRTNTPAKAVYTTSLQEDSTAVWGTPISPDGQILPSTTRRLDKSQWHPIASPWDIFPSLHIPGGERLPFKEIQSSMKQAAAFFATYFHRNVKCFCCCSWILNPLWQELLPHSNIVRFRQEGYAIPGADWGNTANGLFFIFGRNKIDPDTIVPQNRMQAAVCEGARRNLLVVGATFFMVSDLDKLGNKYYLTQFGTQK